jgi:hypothetical protein
MAKRQEPDLLHTNPVLVEKIQSAAAWLRLSVQKNDCDSGDNAQRDENEERDARANR